MNVWPPFRAAGIRVRAIGADWHSARVEMRERLLNRNFVGTHFGGSLFAMTDPFHVVLLLQILGRDYLVWDVAAEIEFLKPGRGTVSSEIRLEPAVIEELRAAAKGGEKVLHDFPVEIRDTSNELVARIQKRVYARLKPRLRPGAHQEAA